MKIKNIAILTSGGDCQGMNTAINIIVRVAIERNYNVFGIMRGFRGLFENDFIVLDNKKVANISSLGGTILKTSRFVEFKQDSIVKKCAAILKKNKIDVLIVIGGDGSYKGALALAKEGIKVICIPGTIDNDLRYTNRCLGFDTAVNNACQYIENVKQTMDSMSRGVVFEVMGRECGDIALYSAISTACDCLAVPEKPITEDDFVKQVKLSIKQKNKPPMVVIAEKMFDVVALSQRLSKETNIEFKYSIVGYIQRGGSPSVADKALATQFGVRTIELIEKGIFNKAVGYKDGKIFEVELDKVFNSDYDFDYDLLNIFYQLNSHKKQ